MAHIREIKKRMVAVGNIQRITKTMQMIATAKFTSALTRAQATKPYTEKVQQLVREVAAAAGEVDHPLITGAPTPARRQLLLTISSDRGLCGAFNGNVLRASLHHVRQVRDNGLEMVVETSGKKAVGFFNFQNMDIERRHAIGDKPRYEEVERIAESYIDQFTNGYVDAVHVAYMRFESTARQVPEVLQLMPMSAPEQTETTGGRALYEFSPSARELLSDLLPRSVKTMLFQAFTDAAVSEQMMRMVAMKAATENAKDLGRSLRRDFNRARQTQITTELMEIIAGAAALE